MGGEWRSVRLGDLVAQGILAVSDGYRVRNEELGPEGIPFVRGGDIGEGWINTNTEDHVRPEFADRVRSKLAQPGDVAFITKGTVGRAGRLRAIQPAVVFAPQVAYWRALDADVLDPLFLFYVVCGPAFQDFLYGEKTHGSMVADYVSISQQHAFCLPLPDIQTQRWVGGALGALDDKIELNRRMSETLEAMARALFKAWFVDFEPVRAKAEGRDLGLPRTLADLFPGSFVGSEVGVVPKGWRLSRLGDNAETLLGGTPSRSEPSYWGGDIPWINSGKANEFRIIEPSEHITRAGLESSATKLLPARTTVIAITGATLGQVSLTEIATCANQSLVGVLGSPELPSEFLYFWVKENVGRLIASQTGGAQQHINKNNVNECPVLLPGDAVVAEFASRVRPVFDRIRTCCFESSCLAELRETLLPRLVSGEIRAVIGRELAAREIS